MGGKSDNEPCMVIIVRVVPVRSCDMGRAFSGSYAR